MPIMNLDSPMPPSLRRTAAWPAWPRRLGTVASGNRRRVHAQRQIDWPLLLFWVGYLALVAAGVWLFLG